jgi:hypothetical protein
LIDTRIMYAFRNRPARLLNTPGLQVTYWELARAERMGNMASELGLAPAEVLRIVVEAIRTDQFYVLTHTRFDEAIRTRTEDMLARRRPARPIDRSSTCLARRGALVQTGAELAGDGT